MRTPTNNPKASGTRVIYNLVDYARSRKVEIVSLATISPTLEDVFVKYTEAR